MDNEQLIIDKVKTFADVSNGCDGSGFKKGSAQALLAALKAHPLPKSAQVSDADIELQVQDISQGWDL
ncbi:MAG: hypothetical protein GQ569_01700 [Methylococcaceae bacterium]|nr:hypothetical protein [Methylococcaceae bacterium]